jgi:hypothetical protein
MSLAFVHPGVSMLAFFQATQLNLFERFLTQAVSGINSTNITSGMQQVAYVVLLVGFLWQIYQSALHGGDVRGLGTNLIKYVVTAIVVMNYSAVFTTINQGFVNAGNWISNASGAGNLLQNWANDLQTQFNQVGFQKLWGLVSADLPGLIDAILILVAYILYPVVIVIFGFFYIFYGSILYIFGPIVIALMPLGGANRLAKSYIENVMIWNAWPILYGGFGALLSAIQMGQIGQMLNQNNFLGGLGNLEGPFLIGIASIIFSLAIAVIPFIAKRIVSGDVGATAGTLLGAAATALTAGVAAAEGAVAGAAVAGGGSATVGAGTGATAAGGGNTAGGAGGSAPTGTGRQTATAGGNQPAPAQRAANITSNQSNASTDNQTQSTGTTGSSVSAVGTSLGVAIGSGQSSGAPGGANSSPGSSEDPGSSIGAAHAETIRGSMQDAMGRSKPISVSSGAHSESPQTSSPSSISPSSPAGGGSGFSPASGRSSAPRSSRYNISSWGAYHAARLATQGAISGANAVGEVGSKAMSAVKDPVRTAGAIGGVAGKAAASVANAASNASRVAQNVTDAVSHPGHTAQRATRAAAGAVIGAVENTTSTVRASVNAAKSGFSDSYDHSRRDNERKT